MPLDPTFSPPVRDTAPIDLKARLVVALMLFTTAPVPSEFPDTEPTDPAFRSSPVAPSAVRSERSFLE